MEHRFSSSLIDWFVTVIRPSFESPTAEGSDVNPVAIIALTSKAAELAEYAWLENKFGQRNVAWKTTKRFVRKSRDGQKWLEIFEIKLVRGGRQRISFDISSFYNKAPLSFIKFRDPG